MHSTAVAPDTPGERRPRILVVEDERVVATDLQRSLQRLGYEVPEPVATAEEALRAARHSSPDLVLMDVRIQGDKDGIDTALELRRELQLPVVYLTAYSDEETLERAKSTGPLGYLLKPIKPKDLRATVETALSRHASDVEVRRRERWLRTILDSIADGVVVTDELGAVTLLNRRAEVLLGQSEGTAKGRLAAELIHLYSLRDQRSRVEGLLEIAVDKRRGLARSDDVLLVNPLGQHVVINDNAAPILDQERLLGAVMAFRDVTERRVLQRELEFRDRLAAMGTLAVSTAHEINNPLTSVLGNLSYVQSLLDDAADIEDPDTHALLQSIQQALAEAVQEAERIRDIVVGMSRVGQSDQVACCSPSAAVDYAMRAAEGEVRQRAQVVLELDEVPAVAIGETRLGQVLLNLIVNAAHAIEPGHPSDNEIRIRVRLDGDDYVLIEVGDTGTGIPEDVMNWIFEPFVTTKPPGQGTGLGLFVCRAIVVSAGGRINVESSPEGTCFQTRLPVAPQA